MRLSEAARYLHAPAPAGDARFIGCATDSRRITREQLFVALPGPRFDGHDFVVEAARRGASCALLQRPVDCAIPSIRVSATRQALCDLACVWRQRFRLPVVAVTGSNGKTTVKEMLSSILSCNAPVLATAGNLNNDIGVPLTLFGLDRRHRYAIIEIGASGPGEVRRLAALSRPQVAVITQCAEAHLAGFGSLDGVAQAKAEIYEALGPEGAAVINADDPYADYWRSAAAGHRQLDFSLSAPAAVRAERWRPEPRTLHSRFTLHTPDAEAPLRLPLPGRHNVMNALAAAAAACALGVDIEQIAAGLAATPQVAGRLQPRPGRQAGVTVLDDSYNANPASLQAALEVLSLCPGDHWLVLGDMAELGARGLELHVRGVQAARAGGVQRLFAVGGASARALPSFGPGARHFADTEALLAGLDRQLQERGQQAVTILVKGSRAMQMDTVVARLLREAGSS